MGKSRVLVDVQPLRVTRQGFLTQSGGDTLRVRRDKIMGGWRSV